MKIKGRLQDAYARCFPEFLYRVHQIRPIRVQFDPNMPPEDYAEIREYVDFEIRFSLTLARLVLMPPPTGHTQIRERDAAMVEAHLGEPDFNLYALVRELTAGVVAARDEGLVRPEVACEAVPVADRCFQLGAISRDQRLIREAILNGERNAAAIRRNIYVNGNITAATIAGNAITTSIYRWEPEPAPAAQPPGLPWPEYQRNEQIRRIAAEPAPNRDDRLDAQQYAFEQQGRLAAAPPVRIGIDAAQLASAGVISFNAGNWHNLPRGDGAQAAGAAVAGGAGDVRGVGAGLYGARLNAWAEADGDGEPTGGDAGAISGGPRA